MPESPRCTQTLRLSAFLVKTRFDIVLDSEIVAILALYFDSEDLQKRLVRIVGGTSGQGMQVTVENLGVSGPLLRLLRRTITPNLAHTTEGQPAFIHAPFR